ncbi:hypothetical protein X975_08655, partial [Stegodyphus mimosarum]
MVDMAIHSYCGCFCIPFYLIHIFLSVCSVCTCISVSVSIA